MNTTLALRIREYKRSQHILSLYLRPYSRTILCSLSLHFTHYSHKQTQAIHRPSTSPSIPLHILFNQPSHHRSNQRRMRSPMVKTSTLNNPLLSSPLSCRACRTAARACDGENRRGSRVGDASSSLAAFIISSFCYC